MQDWLGPGGCLVHHCILLSASSPDYLCLLGGAASDVMMSALTIKADGDLGMRACNQSRLHFTGPVCVVKGREVVCGPNEF